jgi:hypothetical protein
VGKKLSPLLFPLEKPKNTTLGRILRDAKLYEIGAGTSEIRRLVIGRELMREVAEWRRGRRRKGRERGEEEKDRARLLLLPCFFFLPLTLEEEGEEEEKLVSIKNL